MSALTDRIDPYTVGEHDERVRALPHRLPTADEVHAVSEMYVAIRFPSSYVVFHMLCDPLTLAVRPDDAYEELSERVQHSVRQALSEMSVRVIETHEGAR